MCYSMSKKPAKRGRPVGGKMERQLNVRVDDETHAGVEAYRKRHDLREASDAVRQIIRRVLRDEGILK